MAAGVIAFDLRTRTVRWQQHLDLSTDATALKAYTYSAPTLADLDGDGKLEIVIGTSMVRTHVLSVMLWSSGCGQRPDVFPAVSVLPWQGQHTKQACVYVLMLNMMSAGWGACVHVRAGHYVGRLVRHF